MEANEENAQLFDQICSQRDNMRDAISEADEEDVWVPREIKFAETDETENRIKKEIQTKNLSDDDNSSSSSSDEEGCQEMNRVNSYRGSSKPKSQRITNDTTNNNNDIQMEGINEFKTLNPNDDTNWADYVDFNNQGEKVLNNNIRPVPTVKTENTNIEINMKNNLSNDEDNNWANFENFNELTNERCSSPNNTSTVEAANNLNIPNDRPNAYLTTAINENIQINEHSLSKPDEAALPIITPIVKLNSSDETPMESTNSIDERDVAESNPITISTTITTTIEN